MKRKLQNNRVLTLVIALTAVTAFSRSLEASDWWEEIRLKGDFRYRYEMIDKEDKDSRQRHRIRARFGIYGKVSSCAKVGIQLATGSNDPVSTNQTLDDSFSTKRIGLDLAYLEAGLQNVPGLTMRAGKFKNPFFKPGKSELLWDSDWNPEGGAVTFERANDKVTLTMIAAGLWIDERSSSDDSYLTAGQGVVRLHFNEKKSSVAVGGRFFNYINTQGFAPFFDPDDPMGNSVTTVEEDGGTALYYASGFKILELFGEATHKFEKIPVTVMLHYVSNTAADNLKTGWLVGLRVGKAKKPGMWEFRYNYREVEKDAVVGMFTDSDFRGGGTDAKGHEVGAAVQLAKNIAFKVSYFINEIGLEREEMEGFKRLQVDLQLKF